MVKYNLVIKYVDGLKEKIRFNKLFQNQECDISSLINIDCFTSQFKDRYELINFSYSNELVEKRDVKKIIIIEYEFRKLTKRELIIYKDDIKFLNKDYLLKYLLLNYDNVKFLTFLCEVLKDNPIQEKNIKVLKTYINKYNFGFYTQYHFSSELDKQNNLKALEDIINMQFFKYDNKTKKINYEQNGNYKQYRDLAKVISNYSKKYNTPEEIEAFEKNFSLEEDLKQNIKRFIKKR